MIFFMCSQVLYHYVSNHLAQPFMSQIGGFRFVHGPSVACLVENTNYLQCCLFGRKYRLFTIFIHLNKLICQND